MTLEEDIEELVAADPEGFEGISYDDRVLYIANGVYDPSHIKTYIAAGIGPELAGEIELQAWDRPR